MISNSNHYLCPINHYNFVIRYFPDGSIDYIYRYIHDDGPIEYRYPNSLVWILIEDFSYAKLARSMSNAPINSLKILDYDIGLQVPNLPI